VEDRRAWQRKKEEFERYYEEQMQNQAVSELRAAGDLNEAGERRLREMHAANVLMNQRIQKGLGEVSARAAAEEERFKRAFHAIGIDLDEVNAERVVLKCVQQDDIFESLTARRAEERAGIVQLQQELEAVDDQLRGVVYGAGASQSREIAERERRLQGAEKALAAARENAKYLKKVLRPAQLGLRALSTRLLGSRASGKSPSIDSVPLAESSDDDDPSRGAAIVRRRDRDGPRRVASTGPAPLSTSPPGTRRGTANLERRPRIKILRRADGQFEKTVVGGAAGHLSSESGGAMSLEALSRPTDLKRLFRTMLRTVRALQSEAGSRAAPVVAAVALGPESDVDLEKANDGLVLPSDAAASSTGPRTDPRSESLATIPSGLSVDVRSIPPPSARSDGSERPSARAVAKRERLSTMLRASREQDFLMRLIAAPRAVPGQGMSFVSEHNVRVAAQENPSLDSHEYSSSRGASGALLSETKDPKPSSWWNPSPAVALRLPGTASGGGIRAGDSPSPQTEAAEHSSGRGTYGEKGKSGGPVGAARGGAATEAEAAEDVELLDRAAMKSGARELARRMAELQGRKGRRRAQRAALDACRDPPAVRFDRSRRSSKNPKRP
jgi:hypothetical protein